MTTIAPRPQQDSLPHRDSRNWEPDPLRRCRNWVRASRLRRRIVAIIAIILGLAIIPGCIGAIATAQTGTASAASGNSALSWMDVRDSTGLNVTDYVIAADSDSIFHPMSDGLAMVINVEFAGWIVIVTSGIWLIGYVLSFQWLNLLAAPLRLFARVLTQELSVPVILIAASTIGAFCVAWFLLRGHHAKASLQIVTMLSVAVLGPVFLADPLSDVLSSDGWLAQGRDLGISIAAGLNGDPNPQPTQLVATMQEQMADNFARRPLQVWNFGHVVDDQPACRDAWSRAVATGISDNVKTGMSHCGDKAAAAAAQNPSAGQIGAGLLVLVLGTLLLAFAAVLAVKIVRSALDSVYHGIGAIFGFAAGGFVYGASQTFLVRSVVHAFFSAVRMAAEVIFLGLYVLLLGDLFRQAQGQVMTVFVIGAIVEVVAITQLKRLNASLERGNDWVANRFAMSVQAGGAHSGGSAPGMGTVGAHRNGLGMLGTLSALSLIGNSPVTEWLWKKTRTPMRPNARLERDATIATWGAAATPGLGGPMGWTVQNLLNRQAFADAAREGATAAGGIDTVMGAAAAIQGAVDVGAGQGDLNAALQGAGFTDRPLINRALSSWGIVLGNTKDFQLSDERLGNVSAAMQRVQNTAYRLVGGGSGFKSGNPADVAADLATLQAAAYRFRRANEGGVTLDGGNPHGAQWQYLNHYMTDDPSALRLSALAKLANEEKLTNEEELLVVPLRASGIDRFSAQRMWAWLGNEHAKQIYESVSDLTADPSNPQFMRAARSAVAAARATDKRTPSNMYSPWKQLAPPADNTPIAGDWTRLDPAGDLLR
ncbi:hypothetical protein [Nocardia sp. NBC_01327]|uniref:hypothetical protein n=1 Tax=Nocardia sp. NBC_01327 TaxID=2903593 RepID=UPI002E0F6E49|nr:hypothetical protein OG326_41700 [Nocardia sp. NBC_01327]